MNTKRVPGHSPLRTSLKTLSLCLAATLLGFAELPGHGGRYRGAPVGNPGNPPPPSKGTPAPPPKPYVPPPPVWTPTPVVTPSGRNTGPRTPRGINLAPDLSQWQLWWEMNKDQFLLIKQSVHDTGPVTGGDEYYLGAHRRKGAPMSLAPDARQIREKIVPALHRALADTNNPDLVTACLLGLAKIGRDHRKIDLLAVITRYLRAKNFEIRETAALALGVSRNVRALPLLRDLLLDNAAGRHMVKRREVGNRVRAFAAYGLGILANRGRADLRAQAFAALRTVLEDEDQRNRDIQIAAISALGVMGLEPTKSSKEKRLLWQALPVLMDFYKKDLGRGAQVVQAHVPVAIGRLLGRGDGLEQAKYRKLFTSELTRKKCRSNEIVQSAVIALGLLSTPDHKTACDELYRYYQNGRNQQARYFSLIAMGEIGGDENRTRLLRTLHKGKKALERPWAAIALGLMTYRARLDDGGKVDETVGRALERQLVSVKNRSAVGAFAVALGLSGFTDATPRMRKLLEENRNHDELAGFLCVGLALAGDQRAVDQIRTVMHRSVRRPMLLRQSAIALGRLHDKLATRYLIEMIQGEDKNMARMAAVAGALQFVGDSVTVDTLLKRLHDDELTKLSRAFVAAALGGIADPMLLPFSARYAMDCNYRAAVSTFTDQATGILDLL